MTELTDALNAQIVRQSAEFDAWFDDLKGKLGEDPCLLYTSLCSNDYAYIPFT